MTIQSLRGDIRAQIKRLGKSDVADVTNELKLNVYPLLDKIAVEMEELAGDVDGIAGAIDQEGSYITPELAANIQMVFAVAREVFDEIQKPGVVHDELVKKKLEEKIANFNQIIEVAEIGIEEAELEPEEEDDDTEEGDEHDETPTKDLKKEGENA